MNQIKKSNKLKENRKKENILDDDIDLVLFCELATTMKKFVNSLNLHEIKSQILLG